MTTYLNPRSDITFKKVFGNEHYKLTTIKFLNSILSLKSDKQIEQITFIDTENIRESITKKDTFIDIHCIDQSGSHFLIEMQVESQAYFIARALYYLSLTFSRQLPHGVNYHKLVPVICITILDHMKFKHNNVISHYVFTDTKTGEVLAEDYLDLYFIELPKFTKTIDQVETDADAWLFFMTQAENLKSIPGLMQKKQEFQDAFHVLDKMGWTDEEFDAYIAQLDKADKPNRIMQAKFEEGALQEKESVANKLLKKGMPISEIAEITDLSIQQITALSGKKL
jgi:predicted transposase/invertase (TIGR01784 family)